MTESERLKEIRKVLGLTQRELSDALEIKQGSYSDVERGKAGISAVLLKNLIRKYRVNPLWLCEGEGNMFIGFQETGFDIPVLPSEARRAVIGVTLAETNDLINETEIQIDLAERQQQYLDNLILLVEFLKDDA